MEVLTYPEPGLEQKKTAYVGMVVFVTAWAMMFGCLFFIYLALRATSDAWPPMGLPTLPLGLPGLNTAVIIASSLALEFGLLQTRRGQSRQLSSSLAIAALLGLVFIAIQYKIGADLYGGGLRVDGGAYAAVFYGMAGIHAAHVAIGIVPLLYLAAQAFRGKYSAPRHLPVRLWAVYWHFVGVVWILIYVLVFLV